MTFSTPSVVFLPPAIRLLLKHHAKEAVNIQRAPLIIQAWMIPNAARDDNRSIVPATKAYGTGSSCVIYTP